MEAKIETSSILENKSCDIVLRSQYTWFRKSFLPLIQTASDDFFSDVFLLKLISLSENVNILFAGDDYFVTKIRINKNHDVFIRCSEDAIRIILDKILGENKQFNLSNITELEVKIISAFNDYLYQKFFQCLSVTPTKTQKRKNFDTIHLTLFIKDKNEPCAGKIILSLPKTLLIPESLNLDNTNFNISDFKSSKLDVNIKVGTTKFPIKDIKNLEKEDIVIFENSDISSMNLIYGEYKRTFKVNPNPGLIISTNNETDSGGQSMDENSLSQNLWDNIQVEMSAEFDKVKITLGELKNIEQGLVLDLSSVYDNKISLQVEDKTIATGELVIINDRYGVKIDEVFTSKKEVPQQPPNEISVNKPRESQNQIEETEKEKEEEEEEEEEFDYSDFDLDDQDI